MHAHSKVLHKISHWPWDYGEARLTWELCDDVRTTHSAGTKLGSGEIFFNSSVAWKIELKGSNCWGLYTYSVMGFLKPEYLASCWWAGRCASWAIAVQASLLYCWWAKTHVSQTRESPGKSLITMISSSWKGLYVRKNSNFCHKLHCFDSVTASGNRIDC